MRKLLVLMLLICCSCSAQQFENAELQESKIYNGVCRVDKIQDNTATLKTKEFGIEYTVDVEKLEAGKEYMFRLLVHPSHNQRKHNAKVLGYVITPRQAQLDARELMSKF